MSIPVNHRPARSRPDQPRTRTVLALISVGGALGSLARYGLGVRWPDNGHLLCYTTLAINLTGALLLGALVMAVTELWPGRPLLRPALGTGVLGGYTTFSTFAVQVQQLPPERALAYVLASAVGGVLAAAAGMAAVLALAPVRLRRRAERSEPAVIDPDLP